MRIYGRLQRKRMPTKFVSELRPSVDAKIGPYEGGTYLSGGQWQKVAIGRTFLKESAKY